MAKKKKKRSKKDDSLALIDNQLKPNAKILRKKRDEIEGTIEKFPPPPKDAPIKASLLDMYRVDAFVEFGHPDEILMKLVNKNMSMMNWIEVEMERVKNAIRDEDDKPVGPFDLQLAYLHKQFGDSVESKLTKIKPGWEQLNAQQVDDQFLLQAYKNVSFFIEFLKIENPEMISTFISWRTKQMQASIPNKEEHSEVREMPKEIV